MAYGASLPVQAADVVTTVPWDALSARLGDRLLEPQSPFAQGGAAAQEALKYLRNPYYLGDEIGLAQSSGWLGAWTFQPSRHAVAARDAGDVVVAVEFARRHRVRLVVRGGGHSYLPQEVLLYSDTLRNNIAMGRPVRDEEILSLAQALGISDVLGTAFDPIVDQTIDMDSAIAADVVHE